MEREEVTYHTTFEDAPNMEQPTTSNQTFPSLPRLLVWIEEASQQPRCLTPEDMELLNNAARNAVSELAEFVTGLPEFAPHDFRPVDVALLKWVVACWKVAQDPFFIFAGADIHGHPDAEPMMYRITAREDILDAKVRLRVGTPAPYIVCRNADDWYAVGVNREWFLDC